MGSPERSKNTWKAMLFKMNGAKIASPSGTKKFVTSSTPLERATVEAAVTEAGYALA